ncbi:hypothetical protein AALO_G00150460 [Alosa alosa]|uniref:Sec16 Sec23-binding domain-containing protein n=1 Tax=Alosa alosa TaxID=278164 RepID=A0AAV6GI96_9TELE|nr:hypothetical protein AALO_G00150460 [Alosa alosa]
MACHVTGRSAYPDNWRSVVGQRSPGQWHQGDCGSPQYYKVDPKDCRGFLGVQDNNDPPKSEVMAFLKGKALECLRDLSVEDRCSAYLCWQLTALLCQMNGNVTGNDIAELLLCKETAKLRQEEESTVYDLVDIDGKAKRRAKETLSVKAVDVSKPGDWSAASQRFRQLLCAGRAKEALEYAVQKALWGHAFRLASRMGTTELQRVVARFANSMEEGDPLRTLYQIESGRIPDVAPHCGENWYTHLASVLTAGSKGMMEASHFCFVAAQIQLGTLYKVPLKVEIDPDQRTPLVLEATKVPLAFKKEVTAAKAEDPTLADMEASVPISAGPAQVPIPAPMTITVPFGKVKQSYADHYHLNNETGQCIKTTLSAQEVKAVSPAPDVEAAQSQSLIEQKLLKPAADSVTGTPSLRGVNTVDLGKMKAVSPPVTAAFTKDDAPSFKQEMMVATAEVPPLADMEASVPISAGPAQVPIPAPMTITVPLGKVKQSYADHCHLNKLTVQVAPPNMLDLMAPMAIPDLIEDQDETKQCIKTTLSAQEVKAVSPAPDVEAAQSQPLIEQKLLEPAADSVTGTPSLRGVNTMDPGKMEAVSPPVTAASTKDDAPSFKQEVMVATAEVPPLADMEASVPISAGPAQVPIPAPMTITVPLGKVKQSYADHYHLNRPRGRYVDVFATSELTVQVAPPNMLDLMAPMAIPDLIEHQDETGQCIKTTLSAQEVKAVSPAPDVEAAQSQPLIEQKLLEPAADSVTGTPSLRGVNTVDPGKMEAVSPPVTAASTKDDAPSFKQEVTVATAEVPPLADMEASVPISAGPAQVPIPAPMTITVPLGKVKQSYADHYHLNNETGQCIKTTLSAQEVKAVSPAPDVEAAQSQPLIEQKLLEPAADSVTGTPSLRGVNTVDPGKMEAVSPPVTAASTKDDAPSFKQERAATAEDPPLADMEASMPASAGPAQVPIPAPMTITVPLGKVKQSYADHYHLNRPRGRYVDVFATSELTVQVAPPNMLDLMAPMAIPDLIEDQDETKQCIKTTLSAQEVKAVSPAPDVEAAQSQPLIEQKLLEPAADSVTGTPSLRGVNTVDPGKMEAVSPPVTAASTKDDAPSFKEVKAVSPAPDVEAAQSQPLIEQKLLEPAADSVTGTPSLRGVNTVDPGQIEAVSPPVTAASTKDDAPSFKQEETAANAEDPPLADMEAPQLQTLIDPLPVNTPKQPHVGPGSMKTVSPQVKTACTKNDEPSFKRYCRGWLSWIIPRKKEAHLPDDKNKSIFWDESKQKWVDRNEPEEKTKAVPPPPMGPPLMPPRNTGSPTGSGGPSTALPTNGPPVNMFRRIGNKNRYVDIMKPSGDNTKPVESFVSPSMLTLWTPVVKTNIFNPAQVCSGDMVESVTQLCPPLAELSRPPTETETVHDPA